MFRILVVDDSALNLEITSRMLQKAGYETDTAASGETGVSMARQFRYDLIVMDMAMPGIGGGEATRLIRDGEEESGTRRVPVVAFTADTTERTRQKAMRSDMDDIILKPIEIPQLLAAVERSLDDRTIVLVADACAQDRERTLRYLRGLDHVATLGARSGEEALAACERQRVTFALINIGLPDLSGIETAHRIRQTRHGAGIGIILVTDKADQETRKQPIQHGWAGFLEKPYGQAEVLKLIEPLMATA
jgi:hypothetical protein